MRGGFHAVRRGRSTMRGRVGPCLSVAVCVVVVLAGAAPAAWAAPGDLDPGFSGDGKVFVESGHDGTVLDGLAVRSDGRIVVVGTGVHQGADVFQVARLLPGGRLDHSFGSQGFANV